ncbi:MAG: ABC transporter ATP-binding protein [Clostridia bacterium]|nr:ABC transporter ATP-binding protein [Clostridia bacterium]
MDVRIENVAKTFVSNRGTVEALAPVSLDVPAGSFVTILGPSGCGKSTLLRIVAGLEEASQGVVRVGGREVHGPGADRGMVFQAYSLFPWLTVRENIEFGLRAKGVPPRERRAISDEYLRQIGLEAFADRYPKELSGGMKQRVAIARALANDPQVLLLDEPFGALDAQTRAMMQEHVLSVWEKYHKTILFVTHDIEEAVFMADAVVVMTKRPGRIREVVPVDLPRPRDYHVRFTPEFTALKERLTEIIREELTA